MVKMNGPTVAAETFSLHSALSLFHAEPPCRLLKPRQASRTRLSARFTARCTVRAQQTQYISLRAIAFAIVAQLLRFTCSLPVTSNYAILHGGRMNGPTAGSGWRLPNVATHVQILTRRSPLTARAAYHEMTHLSCTHDSIRDRQSAK